MSFDWSNIRKNLKDFPEFISSTIKQSEININKILKYDCINEKDKFLKVLEKDTIEINKIYSILNLMELIFNNPIIKDCINLLTSYNYRIKTNGNLIKKLLYFNKLNAKDIQTYQKKFIENIMSQLKHNKTNTGDKIFLEGIKYNNINVNIYNFNNILLHLKKKERIDLINIYNTSIYDVIMNTLIARYNEAKYNYVDNYFMYKNKLTTNSFNNLKNFITDLIKTVNNQLLKKKDIYMHKNYDYDNLFIMENNFEIKPISLKYFIKKTINFFTEKFQLVFKVSESNNKWSENVLMYEVFKSNKKLGILYLDLIKDENSNKPNIPIFININNSHYNKSLNIQEDAQTCIISSYSDYESKILTFYKSQKLFIEFMLAIFNLFIYNNFGFSNINLENKNIIEILGETIFQNDKFINDFYENNDNTVQLEELQMIKLIKFRYLCIDSLFDIGIHLDNTIISCTKSIIFNQTYHEISRCYSIDQFNYFNINPILLQKINGDFGGKYYHTIFNEIICHNISKIILNKNLGLELFDTLTNIQNDFMTNLKEYLSKYNLINKNMKFIIKTTNKEPEQIDNPNFFKEI
jgi:hypothetical protein